MQCQLVPLLAPAVVVACMLLLFFKMPALLSNITAFLLCGVYLL